MKNIALIITVFLVITSVISAEKAPSLNGTWCVGEEGFILRFSGKDSLHVTSSTDESIQAEGSYNKNDTSFTATVKNGDVTMKNEISISLVQQGFHKGKSRTVHDQ